MLPYILSSSYEEIAIEFLEVYYPDVLYNTQPVPIVDIAKSKMGIVVQFLCLSEETDIYGMTIFDDGIVVIYDPMEGVYESKLFNKKTVLIDTEAVKKQVLGV